MLVFKFCVKSGISDAIRLRFINGDYVSTIFYQLIYPVFSSTELLSYLLSFYDGGDWELQMESKPSNLFLL